MVQRNFRTIVIHDDLYEELRRLGTVTESFNDVIWRLVNKATSGQTLAGTGQIAATENCRDQEILTAK